MLPFVGQSTSPSQSQSRGRQSYTAAPADSGQAKVLTEQLAAAAKMDHAKLLDSLAQGSTKRVYAV